jgi:hypothetical protein
VHLEPGFTRFVHIQPLVGFAGIKEKFPFAAFTGGLACIDSLDCVHRIDLSSAMSFDRRSEAFGHFPSCSPRIRTTDGCIVRPAGGDRLYRHLTIRCGAETFSPAERLQSTAGGTYLHRSDAREISASRAGEVIASLLSIL